MTNGGDKDLLEQRNGDQVGLGGLRHGGGREGQARIQVICLGSGGGPSEDNVTGFLVRAVGSGGEWEKAGVLAVDAGVGLAAITRVFEEHLASAAEVDDNHGSLSKPSDKLEADSVPTASEQNDNDASQPPTPQHKQVTMRSGPFAGFEIPHETARANALYLLHEYISAYLLTHAHLDHISAFAINSAGFPPPNQERGVRPKVVAGLPSTVNAVKQHIFNDVIWPNLTDEDGGVGFISIRRLGEGGGELMRGGSGSSSAGGYTRDGKRGDLRSGESFSIGSPTKANAERGDDGAGYIELVPSLSAKGYKVSHGVSTGNGGPLDGRHRGSVVGLPPPPSREGRMRELDELRRRERDRPSYRRSIGSGEAMRLAEASRERAAAEGGGDSSSSRPTLELQTQIPDPNGTDGAQSAHSPSPEPRQSPTAQHHSPLSLHAKHPLFAAQVYGGGGSTRRNVPFPSPGMVSPGTPEANKHLHTQQPTSPTSAPAFAMSPPRSVETGAAATPAAESPAASVKPAAAGTSNHVGAMAAHACVVDSTAFFLRTTGSFNAAKDVPVSSSTDPSAHNPDGEAAGSSAPPKVSAHTALASMPETDATEILFFGDVEPDSLSLNPRNHIIWHEAARKFVKGVLKGVVIECSFPDQVSDEVLFGHLCPRHLVAELQTLVGFVKQESAEMQKAEETRAAAAGIQAETGTSSPEAEASGKERGLKRKRGSSNGVGWRDVRSRAHVEQPETEAQGGEETEEIEEKQRSRSLVERSKREHQDRRRSSLPQRDEEEAYGAELTSSMATSPRAKHSRFWEVQKEDAEGSVAVSPRSRSPAAASRKPHRSPDADSAYAVQPPDPPPLNTDVHSTHAPPTSAPRPSSPHGPARDRDGSVDVSPTTPLHAEPSPAEFAEGYISHTALASTGRAPIDASLPLAGLKVLIIHVKDNLRDGPHVSQTILQQLREHEERLGLGVDFEVSQGGKAYWF